MNDHTQIELARDLFLDEYTPEFVDRWDELIDWRGRRAAESGFFADLLRQHGVRSVLDIACGTGFHTVTLAVDGFDVTASDGSENMVTRALENARRFGRQNIVIKEAEWTCLSDVFQGQKFDAIVCLGNAFTHLFNHDDRVKALKEIHSLLNDGGIAVVDHRNYDRILDNGYGSKHKYYYTGRNVEVYPEEVCEEFVKFRYEYEDGSSFHLTLCPIRQKYVTDLLKSSGFKDVRRYGDFKPVYEKYDPDFIVQVAVK